MSGPAEPGEPEHPRDQAGRESAPIHGYCDERFVPVRQAFAANFADRGEVGAAVSVLVDGQPRVELHGGWADAEHTRPWTDDTLVNVYSVGKAFVALLLLRLVDEGALGLDDPVASVWPEFAFGGKAGATVRHALCHQAGVPAIRQRLTNDDLWNWSTMADAVAATEAWWEPGVRHSYHTNTYGHLIGEVIRRTSGSLPGAALSVLAEELDADVWVGLPEAEQSRCADVIWAPGTTLTTADLQAMDLTGMDDEARMTWLSYFNPPGYSSVGVVNTSLWRSAQVPSTNTHATATGVARIFAGLVEPGRLLSPALLAEATSVQSSGWCPTLGEDVSFGLGFKPTSSRRPFGSSPTSFGHFGTGGAVGFADPENKVAVGYVMNHVIPRWQSSRNRALIDSVYRCL